MEVIEFLNGEFEGNNINIKEGAFFDIEINEKEIDIFAGDRLLTIPTDEFKELIEKVLKNK